MTTPSSATTDLDGIRSHLQTLLQEDRSTELLDLVIELLRQLKTDNDRLQLRLARLLREKFGQKSEKIPVEQLRLFLEELASVSEASESGPDPAEETLPKPRHPATRLQKKGRKPLPEDLPREEIVLEPPAAEKQCAACGAEKSRFGEERSEVLEFVPGHFKVLVHVRSKYACRQCEGEVVIAPVAVKPIEAGRPGFGLMADVLVKKYADHLPLHRIRGIYRRHGVDLAVSTLVNWVAAGAEALEPIAAAIKEQTLLAHVLQVDDTPLTVLDPTKRGGSKRGHMWAYEGDQAWVTYDYTPNWSAEGPCSFLAGRKGWLQADAYSGYDRLFSAPGAALVEVGCWAHARRYFVKALPTDRRAAVGIHYIGQLYDIEREAKIKGFDAPARLALRRERSKPVTDALGQWISQTFPAAPPKSPLGEALTYAVNQWNALTRFLEDGRLELDNNACERALRQIAVGRKNWLFAGSDEGAERAAVIYTVFGTCRLHGIDPWAYVRDVLEKLAGGWLQSRVSELLPPNWLNLRTIEIGTEDPLSASA